MLLLLLLVVVPMTQCALELNSITPLNLTQRSTLLPLPPAARLALSVALCASAPTQPRFFVANASAPDAQIELATAAPGLAVWTGALPAGGVLTISAAAAAAAAVPLEIGLSDSPEPLHQLLPAFPHFADSTANQALLFSPPFAPAPSAPPPTFPNYSLPDPAASQPPPPPTAPNISLVLAPTASTNLSALPQTACAIRAAPGQAGAVQDQGVWLRGDALGWRAEWVVGNLDPSTNYTAYLITNASLLSTPAFFATKSAAFACPLVHDLPFCPDAAWAMPVPPPPAPLPAHNASTLPSNLTAPILQYAANFSTNLLSFACGRDVYSPLQTCAHCFDNYRRWLCLVSLPRCAEPPLSPSQTLLPALAPQAPSPAPLRNSQFPAAPAAPWSALLPCIETCHAADRACPIFLGFRCPLPRFNASASYGVGFVDSGAPGVQGGGATGAMQDRFGNVWCNGA